MAVALTGVGATGQINSVGAPGLVALTLPLPKFALSGAGAVPDVLLSLPVLKLVAAAKAGVLGDVALTLPAPSVVSTGPTAARPTLPVPKLAASGLAGTLGEVALSLPVPQVVAYSQNGVRAALPSPVLAATGLTGVVGSVTMRAPAVGLVSAAEVPYTAGGALSLSMLQLAVAGSVGQAASLDLTLCSLALAIEGATGVIGEATLTLPMVRFTASGYQPVIGAVQLSLPHLQLAVTSERVAVTPSAGSSNTFAMHTEAMAVSTYSNFPFNSFARFNGLALGACDSGIFSLGGNTDNGALIQAAARVGMTDFGTSFLKRVDRVYVGYRADGNLVLRVFTDEINQRDYLLRATGKTGLHGNHTRLGKGLVARYYQFELRNQDGADFELNMIEIKPTKLRRRVGGGDA